MGLTNLAGRDRERNNKQILAELERCGIFNRTWDGSEAEVRCSWEGVLSPGNVFVFRRAWRYWMVSGCVPLAMAQRMYEHPVGKTDIRVCGHAGCPPPVAPWVEWRDTATGKKYARMKDADDMFKFKTNHPEMFEKFMNEHLFHDDPASVGAVGTVDSYHIDTELGLYVFVQFIKGQL